MDTNKGQCLGGYRHVHGKNHIRVLHYQLPGQPHPPAKFELCNHKNLELARSLMRQNTAIVHHFMVVLVGSYGADPQSHWDNHILECITNRKANRHLPAKFELCDLKSVEVGYVGNVAMKYRQTERQTNSNYTDGMHLIDGS